MQPTNGKPHSRPRLEPLLSVIIPTLNEACNLPALLADIAAQDIDNMEVIVADGGSEDDTGQAALAAGVRYLRSPSGRARQLNTGARAARAPVLLFLHADSRLRQPQLLSRALDALHNQADPRSAGHFSIRFARQSTRNALNYRYMEEKSAFNRPYTTNGDQGLLIPRTWFEQLGGYDESQHFLEDQKLVATIRRQGRLFTLPGWIETSARRFEVEGLRARYILMAIIMAMYVCDLQAFFRQAPAVYAAQSHTGTLLLTPYFRLLRRLMRQLGWRESAKHWYTVGDFVLRESWQLFYLADVSLRKLLGPGRYPLLALHDRWVAPLIHHRPGAAVVAVLVFIYSMVLLAGWYRLREHALLK